MDLELTKTKIPLNNIYWYPNLTFTTYRLIYIIQAFFWHWLPAYFMDAVLYCIGRKTK